MHIYFILLSLYNTHPEYWASQVVLVVRNPPSNAGDIRDSGSIPGSGRSPGGGYGNPLQYSCLENSMDREAWWAAVHGVAKSQTWLKRLSTYACAHPEYYLDLPWFSDPRHLLLLLTESRWMSSHALSGPEKADPEAGNGTDESHQLSCPPPRLIFWPHSMWNLSFPTKDWTHAPRIGSTEFQPLAPGKSWQGAQNAPGLGLRGEASEARMVGV